MAWKQFSRIVSTKSRPPILKSVKLYRKIGHFSLRMCDIIEHLNKVYSIFITFFSKPKKNNQTNFQNKPNQANYCQKFVY